MVKKTIKKGGAKIEDCIKKKKLWNPKTKRCVNDTKLNRDKGAITPDKKVKSKSPEFNKKGHNKSGFDKNGEWWYDSDGYDIDGYDANGYDIDGYDIKGKKKSASKKTKSKSRSRSKSSSISSQIKKITPTSAVIDKNDGIKYPELKFKTGIKVGGSWWNPWSKNSVSNEDINISDDKESIPLTVEQQEDDINKMKEQLQNNIKDESDILEKEKQDAIDAANLQYEKSLEGEDLRQHHFKQVGLDDETVNNNLIILLEQQIATPINNTMVPTIIRIIKEKQADSDNFNNDESLYNIIKNYPELTKKICESPSNDEIGLYRLKGIGSLTNNTNNFCL